MVIVNTVVIVQAVIGRGQPDVALALGCFGGGSMFAALLLPRILDNLPDRAVMVAAATLLAVVLVAFGGVLTALNSAMVIWPALLATWTLLGLGYSGVLTPTGRLLRRSAQSSDRPALFAAQFALSHACWLLTYPLAGWLGSALGMATAFIVLGALTLIGAALAAMLWPAHDPEVVEHDHRDLTLDHPHLGSQGHRHSHVFVVDDLHPRWPSGAR
jgi:MFS family permease